jgi:hypothetical protein
MLADQLDYVVGVDPHRDSHALAIVHVVSGGVVFEAAVAARSQVSRTAAVHICRPDVSSPAVSALEDEERGLGRDRGGAPFSGTRGF